MLTELLDIDELPRQKSSQVKNQWGEVVRLVHQSGSVAITNHANVEMVLVDAAAYRELTHLSQTLKARHSAVLDELNQRFAARLAVLQQPDARKNLKAMLKARGKSDGQPPKAGPSY